MSVSLIKRVLPLRLFRPNLEFRQTKDLNMEIGRYTVTGFSQWKLYLKQLLDTPEITIPV